MAIDRQRCKCPAIIEDGIAQASLESIFLIWAQASHPRGNHQGRALFPHDQMNGAEMIEELCARFPRLFAGTFAA